MRLTFKTAFFVLIAFFTGYKTYAQTGAVIKGVVADTTEKAGLANAVVTLTDAKDQFLVAYTRAGNNGSFTLPGVKPGSYMLTVSYPKYVDFIDVVNIAAGDTALNLKRLGLVLQSRMLKEVVIRGAAPVKVKGDTTEYAAKDYVIQPNSKVEDLLKQLPGMQVDRNGNITAQGQTVTKVLVDGEEFFGDDPKLVTRNVRGDMVDKVQMYDDQSDRAKATGVDDADKIRTLNITLKQDKKKGSFGNGEATIATNKYYTIDAFINGFTAKYKAAVFATASTLGNQGLSFSDLNNLGGRNMRFRGDNIAQAPSANDLADWNGNLDGNGLPTVLAWGGHFDSKALNNKLKYNLNYIGNDIKQTTAATTLQVRTLPGTTQTYDSEQGARRTFGRNGATTNFEYAIDSTSKITVDLVGGVQRSGVNSYLNSTTKNERDVTLNSTNQRVNNSGDGSTVNFNVFYSKRLAKPGRSVSVNLANAYNTDNNDGTMNNTVTYGRSTRGLADSVVVTDQRKVNRSEGNSFSGAVTYSEPVAKNFTAIADYEFTTNNSTSKKLSYNKDLGGVYDVLDSLYSNDFKLTRVNNIGGLTLAYQNSPIDARIGLKVNNTNYQQTDAIGGFNYNRNYTNYNPNANIRVKTGGSSFLRLNYSGTTRQPGINQLQPVRQNNNPLNLVIGNPNLKPYFNNDFRLDYNSFNLLASRFINVSGNVGFTNNTIINYTSTDTLGVSVQRFENFTAKKPFNYSLRGNYNKQFRKSGWQYNMGASITGNTYYAYASSRVTGYEKRLNETQSNSYALGVGFRKDKEEKYDIGVRLSLRYSVNKSNFNTGYNANGWTYNANIDGTLYLPWKFELAADADLTYRAATSAFPTPIHSYVVNAYLRKRFLKSEALVAQLAGYDLLKQNIGFSQTASNGIITQQTNLVIQRYFSLSLKYEFNRMGGADAGPANRMEGRPMGRPGRGGRRG